MNTIDLVLVLVIVCLLVIPVIKRKTSESDLALFRVIYEDGSVSDHIISKNHVPTMLKATLRLHYKPGLNPHNGNKTAEIIAICLLSQIQKGPVFTSKDFKGDGPYWWTTPDLQNNDDPLGAKIYPEDLHYEVEWGEVVMLWERNDARSQIPNLDDLARDGNSDLKKKRNKKTNKDFSAADISPYLRKYMKPETGVVVLEIGEWATVGGTRIKLLETTYDLDFSYARFATENKEDTDWVTSGESAIPGTNIVFDTWYVGDSTGGVILAFEVLKPELEPA